MTKDTPSQSASRQEQVDLLLEALAELPDDKQRVVELRDFEGLSFAEIARAMGRSENAVQLLHTRALARLAGILRSRSDG